MHDLLTYVLAHPELTLYTVLTVLVAIVKRTTMMSPEQFTKLPPWFAKTVKLLATILPDVVKFVKLVNELKRPDELAPPSSQVRELAQILEPDTRDTLRSFPAAMPTQPESSK